MTPPITLYQRHRLLDEVTQRPGQSTQQLAALISVNYKVAYRALRRHALAGLVYSISIGGMGVMQQSQPLVALRRGSNPGGYQRAFCPPQAQEARQCAKWHHRSRSLLPPLLATPERTAGNDAAPGGVPCLSHQPVTASVMSIRQR